MSGGNGFDVTGNVVGAHPIGAVFLPRIDRQPICLVCLTIKVTVTSVINQQIVVLIEFLPVETNGLKDVVTAGIQYEFRFEAVALAQNRIDYARISHSGLQTRQMPVGIVSDD